MRRAYTLGALCAIYGACTARGARDGVAGSVGIEPGVRTGRPILNVQDRR